MVHDIYECVEDRGPIATRGFCEPFMNAIAQPGCSEIAIHICFCWKSDIQRESGSPQSEQRQKQLFGQSGGQLVQRPGARPKFRFVPISDSSGNSMFGVQVRKQAGTQK